LKGGGLNCYWKSFAARSPGSLNLSHNRRGGGSKRKKTLHEKGVEKARKAEGGMWKGKVPSEEGRKTCGRGREEEQQTRLFKKRAD